ncbi:MAG: hypothetical protein ACETVO_00650, partial [bacterium]
LSMLYFADEKGHVPIIALDQGTLVVWANPDANKENPSQEDINAATRLRLTIVYHLAKGLREKGKNVGFLLDRPALEALNDKGAEGGRVSNLVIKGLLPSDFKTVVKDVSFVAQMEETRGKRGLIPREGKLNVYDMYPAQRRDGFTVKEAMELGVRMIKSNVFFYCGSRLTKEEKQFNEEQWIFIEELAKECRENNIGYVSELLFMVPVNKKSEEKEYQKTKEYMEAHAMATIEAAKRMKRIKGITLQKLAHPYPGEVAMSMFSEEERQAKLKELSAIVPGGWLILSVAEGWGTFHKKVLEAARYGQITGMLVGLSPIKGITYKKENKAGKTVDTIKPYGEVAKVLQGEAVEKELTLLGYIDEAPGSIWQGLGLSKDAVTRMPAVRRKLRIAFESTHTKTSGKILKGPSLGLLLFSGLLSLFIISVAFGQGTQNDVFALFREYITNGQEAGWRSIFALLIPVGILGGLICTIGIGGLAMYRRVGLGRSGLMRVEQFRLPEDSSLRSVRQVLKSLLERGRGFVAALLHRRPDRGLLRGTWLNLQEELPKEEIDKRMELARKLAEGEVVPQSVARGERSSVVGPMWTSLPGEMALRVEKVEEIQEVARMARDYEVVAVIAKEGGQHKEVAAAIAGEMRSHPKVFVLESKLSKTVKETIKSKINLEKALIVVSSPGPTYEYCLSELTKFYEDQGISGEEVAPQVGRHFVGIVEADTLLAEEEVKEASEREFLETFNGPEGLLVLLALTGMNIKGFLESVKIGEEMRRRKNLEENPVAHVAAFQEVMGRAGWNRTVWVLPNEQRGFVKWWQGLISLRGGESKGIIPIVAEELSGLERFGNEAFIKINVRRGLRAWLSSRWSITLGRLKEGNPVLEITLPGKKAIGALFYGAGFAAAAIYAMRINPPGKSSSLPATSGSGKVSLAETATAPIVRSEPLSKYPVKSEDGEVEPRNLIVLNVNTFWDIRSIRKGTPWMMKMRLEVTPKSAGFEVIKSIIEAQAVNLAKDRFVFVSSIRDVREEVIKQMLTDSMIKCGISAEVVSTVIDNSLIITERELREAGAIVDKTRTPRISTKAVLSVISRRLPGSTSGIRIITDKKDMWRDDVTREMMKRILWMELKPAKEAKGLSTEEGAVVAIEGRVPDWLIAIMNSRYTTEEVEILLDQIKRERRIILRAEPVDESLQKFENQKMIYEIQA